MKYINIFLSSSISDMHSERAELENYIRALNDLFHGKGIYCRLHMCEDISDEIAKTRKQDEYNDVIRKSDYFFVMFWHSAGAYTIEEFDVALEQFRKSGAPKISTFFKRADDNVEDKVKDFMKRLKEDIQHCYTVFNEIDTVKLKILLMLVTDFETLVKVEFKDAKVLVDGKELDSVNLEKLPLYANHKAIKELRTQLQNLETDFIDAKLAVADASDDAAMNKLLDVSARRNKVLEQLHKYEMELMQAASSIVLQTESGEYLTQRAQLAIKLFDRGEVEQAQAILDDKVRKREASYLLEVDDENKKEIMARVKEVQIKIDTIKAQGVTKETAEKIISLYEEAEDYIKQGRLDRECLIDYVIFLVDQNQYDQAIEKAEKLYHYFKSLDEPNEKNISQAANILAGLYIKTNRLKEAEELCKEALLIRRRLAESNLAAYEPDVAITCNNLDSLYNDTDWPEDAEELYTEALSIYRRLAESNPAVYEPSVAMTCNVLAAFYDDTDRLKEAEELRKEALSIYRRLAESNPAVYEPSVAMTCNVLAAFYDDTDRPEKAEELYTEALPIYRRLAESNPAVYEPYVVRTCNILVNLYNNTDWPEKAEELYTEALSIYRRLAESNPAVYEPYVVRTCNILAILYDVTIRPEEAEELYKEALPIYRKLAENDPAVYEPDVVRTCNNLAFLYKKTNRPEEAEELYKEALSIYRRLAESNPSRYEPDVAMTCNDLADLYEKSGHIEDSKKPKPLEQAQIGDTVLFGTYEQDNDLSNGPEDIEWIVLDKEDNKALLISKYALDCKPFNTERCDATWETSSIRRWLNSDFLNAAFSAKEQAMIPVSTVFADEAPYFSTDPGNATQDRIFLLSIPEAYEYFASDSDRTCQPAAYAEASGVRTYAHGGGCLWWLRSPGYIQEHAAGVYVDGGVDEGDYYVDYDYVAVRPALWINLDGPDKAFTDQHEKSGSGTDRTEG